MIERLEGKVEEIWQTKNTPRTHEREKEQRRKTRRQVQGRRLFHPSNILGRGGSCRGEDVKSIQ